MGAPVRLRTDFSAGVLRQLAKRAEDADQTRRLLALAAVLDGMSRKAAAEIGAMDRQTLRDWAHRFNDKGPEGLINAKAPGPVPKLSPEQKQELKRIVEADPDPARDGVVRWQRRERDEMSLGPLHGDRRRWGGRSPPGSRLPRGGPAARVRILRDRAKSA